ncbi:MAG TPA: hypothetical protein VN682_00605 [Terriglobales bacterium]|nr:hypothetical protein [Terriglobales bacterium]
MGSLFSQIPLAVLSIATIASAYRLWESLLGLRAKSRLHHEIIARAKIDDVLRDIIERANHAELTALEVEMVREEIEKVLSNLSEKDQKLVEEGLSQPSRVGTKKYVTELLTAA